MTKITVKPTLKVFILGFFVGFILLSVVASAMLYTDKRPFCSSCHVMEVAAITHKMSTHSNLGCNECHAPHNLAVKLPFKAKEGLRDFVFNALGYEAPIRANDDTRNVINANCKSCHAVTNVNVASMSAKPYCIDCHRSIAHMHQTPISKRMVADE